MKQKEWNRVRAQVKQQFLKMGVTRCEQCGAGYPLSFAHRYKRRFITTLEELATVALLCIPCHEKAEFAGHDKMFEIINGIIQQRNEQI